MLCDYPVLTMGRRLVARTMGWVVIQYHPVTGPTEDHELHHVKQCMLWGPFIIIAYPLASLWAYLKGGDAYSDNWFEKAARRAAGQEV
ncbi:MAG TPA: hypothetical protein VEA41_15345 [Salinarimonas sp.]|nr:hypothetical protein [Salinarimonas sp.]